MNRLFGLIGWDDPRMTRLGLARLFCGVVLLFALVAALRARLAPDSPGPRRTAALLYLRQGWSAGEQALHDHLVRHPEDEPGWLLLVEMRGRLRQAGDRDQQPFLDEPRFLSFLDRSKQPGPQVLRAWYAWHGQKLEAALALLDPARGPREAVARARIYRDASRTRDALAAAREADRRYPAHRPAALLLLELLVQLERHAEAHGLLDQPRFREAADPRLRYELYRKLRDYRPMLIELLRLELEQWKKPWLLGPCLVAGLGWYLLCLQMGRHSTWGRGGRLLASPAALLGFLSTAATLCAVVLQDEWTGRPGPGTSFQFNLLYCVAGIGLREELLKLLFFLPLAPYLVRQKNDAATLGLASLVGLGFGVAENLSYYARSSGTAALGRFLTANFLHMALTGYLGYYLVGALRHGGEKWGWFAGQAAQIVVLHGVYDFFLIDPRAQEYGIVSLILFIWLGQLYLRLMFDLARGAFRPIPLTRLFVLALGLAAGAGYLFAAHDYGLWQGAIETARSSLGAAVFAFMYFHEFDETVA